MKSKKVNHGTNRNKTKSHWIFSGTLRVLQKTSSGYTTLKELTGPQTAATDPWSLTAVDISSPDQSFNIIFEAVNKVWKRRSTQYDY